MEMVMLVSGWSQSAWAINLSFIARHNLNSSEHPDGLIHLDWHHLHCLLSCHREKKSSSIVGQPKESLRQSRL